MNESIKKDRGKNFFVFTAFSKPGFNLIKLFGAYLSSLKIIESGAFYKVVPRVLVHLGCYELMSWPI